jgi:DnaK suppressor protein
MSIPQQNTPQIKRLLLERRAGLEQRRERVERDACHRNDPLVSDFSDQAIQRQNDQTLAAIGAAAELELAGIDAALERIEQGLYGACRACGEPIEPIRLQAVPYAVLCADCASA